MKAQWKPKDKLEVVHYHHGQVGSSLEQGKLYEYWLGNPGDLLHELKVGRQLREFKRRISRGTGIEPAYHKSELGERDRDKDPMDGEKSFPARTM